MIDGKKTNVINYDPKRVLLYVGINNSPLWQRNRDVNRIHHAQEVR